MSSPYQGNAANITQFATSTISNATNATPIVITTSAAHLYASGDTVVITGVTGNTAANGTFVIAVTGSTSFTLTGSVGNGAYAGGGTAKDINLLPFAATPSNGDVFTVDQLNTYLQNLADKIQFLALKVQNRLISINSFSLATLFSTVSATYVDTGLSGTYATASVGDIFYVAAPVSFYNTAGVAQGNVSLVVVDGGTPTTLSLTGSPSVAPALSTMVISYTVVNAGVITFKVQAVAVSGTTTVSGAGGQQSRLIIQQFRP